MQSGRFFHGSVTIGQNAFIVGGYSNNTIDIYDKHTKTFQTVNTLNEIRSEFGICAIKGNILISGGYKVSLLQKSCFLYKPSSNTFKPIASMNVERRGHALVNMNDKFVYSIGGWNKHDDYLNSVEKYNPETDVWTIVDQKLNIARDDHQAVAYKHYIYVIGGINKNSVVDSIEKIDTRNETVILIDTKMKEARYRFALAKIDNNAYILGGVTSDSIKTDTVEIFDMKDEKVTDGVSIPIEDYGSSACVL